jgi:MFS family permease
MDRDSTFVDSAGVDEVSIIPWPLLRGKKVVKKAARRIGLNRAWATLIVLLAGLFTVSFTITVLVVSLETIATDLKTTTSTINWALTGPMLAFGVVGPAFGKAGDLWGHKRVFVLGLLFAGIFAALTAVAWNATSMIAFRTLSATAGSATSPSALSYVNRLFHPEERVRPLGYWSFVTAGAPVLGVVIGAPIVASVGWRIIFIVQAPLCMLGVLVAWRLLPETERLKNVKFDIAGSVTLGIGTTSLLLSINRGHSWGWTSAPVLALMFTGVIVLMLFVRIERRAEAPLLPLKWLRTRNVVFPISSQALTNYAYMGGFFVMPQLMDKGLGYSTSHIGWLVIARPLVFTIVAPSASFLTVRIGERRSGMIGAFGVLCSMLLLSTVGMGTSDWIIAVGLGLSGAGLGLASPALTSLVTSAVHDQDVGVAGAMQQLMTQLGAVIGTTVMITIHETTMSSGVIQSYGFALLSGAFVAGLGIVAAGASRSLKR